MAPSPSLQPMLGPGTEKVIAQGWDALTAGLGVLLGKELGSHLSVPAYPSFLKKLFFSIYLFFEREKQHTAGEGQRGGGHRSQSRLQALNCQHGA